jgi:hypothetical protein
MTRIKKISAIMMSFLLVITMLVSHPFEMKAAYSQATNVTINVTYRNGNEANGTVKYSVDGTNFSELPQGNIVTVENGESLALKIVPNDGYEVDFTGIAYQEGSDAEISLNNNPAVSNPFISGAGYTVSDDVTTVTLSNIEFREASGNNNNPSADYNHTAVINISGPQGSWSVNPMVWEDYDTVSEDGCTASYNNYALVTSVGFEGGQSTNALNQYRQDANFDELRSQTISYNRDDSDTTVDFVFFTNWGNRIEEIKINDVSYDVPLNFDSRYDWLNAFSDQGIRFTVSDVPVSANVDGSGNEIYNVQLKVRPITEEECYIGNFLWSNDTEHFDPEVLGYYDDQYIGHSRLELLSVTFNNGQETLTKTYEELRDASGNETYPYVHFQLDRENFETHALMSEMVIPEGSWVTMKIEPEYGYQVKRFDLGAESIQLGTSSVFSFQIGKGNFHIGAHVEPQEDDSKVESDVVSDAELELADGTLDYGSGRLYVEDVEVSGDTQKAFEEFAEESGAEIDSVMNISLSQVFFKGTGDDNDVWATDIESLDNAATISLDLEGYDGEDLVLLHDIHDSGKLEEIPLTYNSQTGKYEAEVSSFSNFAVAKKASSKVDYTIKDENGKLSISFKGDKGKNYEVSVVDYLNMTDEEITAGLGLTVEQFKEIIDNLKNALSTNGTVLEFWEIEVHCEGETITDGPFTVKIKMTDEMKKYNHLEMIYVDLNEQFELQNKEVYVGTIEGDYVTFVLPHLSPYVITGSNVNTTLTNTVRTSDTIPWGFPILGLGLIVLATGVVYKKKSRYFD